MKPGWKARKREIVTLGFDAPGIGAPFKLYDGYLQKMEDALARPALAHRRDLLARRYRHGALRQPARHAGHGGDVERSARGSPTGSRGCRRGRVSSRPSCNGSRKPLADDFATFGARELARRQAHLGGV